MEQNIFEELQLKKQKNLDGLMKEKRMIIFQKLKTMF